VYSEIPLTVKELWLSKREFNLCIVAEMLVTIVLYKYLCVGATVRATDNRHSDVKPAIILYASMMFRRWIGEVLLGG
jgi:hypothetical protein